MAVECKSPRMAVTLERYKNTDHPLVLKRILHKNRQTAFTNYAEAHPKKVTTC